jgi:hypothetical protein
MLRGCAGENATDDCDGNVIDNVVIEKAISDEAENSPLLGDGNTRNHIVSLPAANGWSATAH